MVLGLNKKVKYHLSRAILFSLLSITISFCNKQNEFDDPLVLTGDVINITDTSATFTAKITNPGKFQVIESGFVWGLHSNDNNGIKVKNGRTEKSVYSLQTNYKLLPGKKYYVRAYVLTNVNVTYGREVTFESPAGQINLGKWSKVIEPTYYYNKSYKIRSCFTQNNISYFCLEDGTLYSYDHNTGIFSYVLTNQILSYAYLSVVYDNNVYIFSKDAFYRFDPLTYSFNKLTVLNEAAPRYENTGFLLNDNIYVGSGLAFGNGNLSDYWQYNITTDTWKQIASFPETNDCKKTSFCIDNIGYSSGAGSFRCYDPVNDQWINKDILPFAWDQIMNASEFLMNITGTSTDNFGYFFLEGNLFEYNPVFDYWEKMTYLKINNIYSLINPYLFSYNNLVYVASISNDNSKKYLRMYVFQK
jgi:hypothetical protein